MSALSCFLQRYSQQPRQGNKLSVHQWVNGFSPEKERTPATCDSLDGPCGHYASEISHRKANTAGSHLCVESKTAELAETRIEEWLPGSGGIGKMLVKGCKLAIVR